MDLKFAHLLGKKVQCEDKDGQIWVGTLQFAGINELLHGEYQVTLDRTPLWPVDPNTIKPYNQQSSIFIKK